MEKAYFSLRITRCDKEHELYNTTKLLLNKRNALPLIILWSKTFHDKSSTIVRYIWYCWRQMQKCLSKKYLNWPTKTFEKTIETTNWNFIEKNSPKVQYLSKNNSTWVKGIWMCVLSKKRNVLLTIQKNKLKKLLDADIGHYWKMIMDDEKYLTLTNEFILDSTRSIQPLHLQKWNLNILNKSFGLKSCVRTIHLKIFLCKTKTSNKRNNMSKAMYQTSADAFYQQTSQYRTWSDLQSSNYVTIVIKFSFFLMSRIPIFYLEKKIHRHVLFK